ncbi:uncharacterized protein LOC100877898 isoform X2 [Megachile rotundata]|nr:PREDICTED: uncharacterized protein LOC100877898 isoform X2 [Megachile rotundata]
MHISNQENLKLIQKWIPEATLDHLDDLDNCMNSEAIYKCGLPAAAISAVLAHALIPNSLKRLKLVLVGSSGLVSFMLGRIVYGGTLCQQKVFGPIIAKRSKRNVLDSPNFLEDVDQENQQSKLVTPSDKLLEDDSSWTNFDPYLDSNVSYFDDTGSNFQQDFPTEQLTELPVEQPVQEKKRRVTYDELWAQNAASQMKR